MKDFDILEQLMKVAIHRQLSDGAINIVILKTHYVNSSWCREWLSLFGCKVRKVTDDYIVLYVPIENRQLLKNKTLGKNVR